LKARSISSLFQKVSNFVYNRQHLLFLAITPIPDTKTGHCVLFTRVRSNEKQLLALYEELILELELSELFGS
jgi:hypothetical protein